MLYFAYMAPLPPSPTSWYRIWTMLRDPKGPRSTKIATIVAVLYLLWPADLMPDVVPVLGWLDDIGITAVALWWLNHVASTYKQS